MADSCQPAPYVSKVTNRHLATIAQPRGHVPCQLNRVRQYWRRAADNNIVVGQRVCSSVLLAIPHATFPFRCDGAMIRHLLQAREELDLDDAVVSVDGIELTSRAVRYTWIVPIRVAKDGIYSHAGAGTVVVKLPADSLCAVAVHALQGRPVVIAANNAAGQLHVTAAVLSAHDDDWIEFTAQQRTKPFVLTRQES